MMKKEDLRLFLQEYINEETHQIILSKPRDAKGAVRVKIRPVQRKGEFGFQAALRQGTKEFHQNYRREELLSYLETQMEEQFMQMQIQGAEKDGFVLVSKKGKLTLKGKGHPKKERTAATDHNRKKHYLLEEGIPVPFLVDLGVMTPQGKVAAARYGKFRQINRFLEFIRDVVPRLPREREVSILDFGCGKSYLTFAMYYYLHERLGLDVRILGLDLKEDVIEHCNALAKRYGYEKLSFLVGDIAGYQGRREVDMVVTLHACDTATDYALQKAVEWKAQVILSVPCCQHELNAQLENETLSPVLSYGILKERMAALITDGLRAQLLECCGYETQILEFIDMEHTPKNLLIRAVRTGKKKERKSLDACMEALHVSPALDRLLRGKGEGL